MAYSKACYKLITTITILLLYFTFASLAENVDVSECRAESGDPSCHNNKEAKKLKMIAIPSILVASMIGVSLQFLSRYIPALGPDRVIFGIIKTLTSGVILATAFMHVLPDSFDDLTSKCLPEEPWRKFPFTTFIAMNLSFLVPMIALVHLQEKMSKVAGVVVSVVFGLTMGASDNQCTIRSLIAAFCFHELAEGMRLGGPILHAEFKSKMNWKMVLSFPVTMQFGIALGMQIQKIYGETSPTSPTALILMGMLNACSAGLLIDLALVNLLAHELYGPKIQGNMKLHVLGYVATFIGAAGMSLMAKWA
ncbi:Zinc/iron permease [Arabidopsis suecica]|uniref:Zinc/iron permease n=1 Tax=Arabidopsis suecica TaxID=45249 RepID=A0A8T2FXD9_ARASU|nr:Zinc/iron permease [Arabidopsis suecica]